MKRWFYSMLLNQHPFRYGRRPMRPNSSFQQTTALIGFKRETRTLEHDDWP
jgi:hypothetical protein